MNNERGFIYKFSWIFNHFMLYIYAFIFYFYVFLYDTTRIDNIVFFVKAIALYILISFLVPFYILYILTGYSFKHVYREMIESNRSFFIIAIFYFVSFLYFSMFRALIWFNIGLLLPMVVSLFIPIAKRFVNISLDLISIGALTCFIIFLTFGFHYIFSIYPLLVCIFLSGLVSYINQYLGYINFKESLSNYFLGAFITIIILFYNFIIK